MFIIAVSHDTIIEQHIPHKSEKEWKGRGKNNRRVWLKASKIRETHCVQETKTGEFDKLAPNT